MTENSTTLYPKYLDEIFFRTCLLKGLKYEDIVITNFNLSMGSNPGQNLTSFIYRAIIDYRNTDGKPDSVSLIVKSIPTDGNREHLAENKVYDIEVTFYSEILPHIQEFISHDRVAAKFYYATRDPIQTIVFDDLTSRGYLVHDDASGIMGLDEAHCKVVLEKIGELHAASLLVIKKKLPHLREQFKWGIISPKNVTSGILAPFFQNNLRTASRMVADMPGCEKFAPHLMFLYENFASKTLESVNYSENDINVLNHGDIWINNILFKYDEGKPTDSIFIDFQSTFVNSLGCDLNCFFATTANLDVLKRKYDLIRAHYYPAFQRTLTNAGYEAIPSVDCVMNEVRKRELVGLFFLIGDLPLLLMKPENKNTNNYGDYLDEKRAEKAREDGMSHERFLATLQCALKQCDEIHLFNDIC